MVLLFKKTRLTQRDSVWKSSIVVNLERLQILKIIGSKKVSAGCCSFTRPQFLSCHPGVCDTLTRMQKTFLRHLPANRKQELGCLRAITYAKMTICWGLFFCIFSGDCSVDLSLLKPSSGQLSLGDMIGVLYCVYVGIAIGIIVLIAEWCVASYWEVDPTDPAVRLSHSKCVPSSSSSSPRFCVVTLRNRLWLTHAVIGQLLPLHQTMRTD